MGEADVIGYVGLYRVLEDGRVYSMRRGKYLRPYMGKSGYYVVHLSKSGQCIPSYVHRLVAIHFIKRPDGTYEVNHKDGNKKNNSLDNLEWVTTKENMRHAFRTGLNKPPELKKGAESIAAKLTEVQVKQIKARLRSGESCREIAKDYGVCFGTIGHIKYGKTWTRVG